MEKGKIQVIRSTTGRLCNPSSTHHVHRVLLRIWQQKNVLKTSKLTEPGKTRVKHKNMMIPIYIHVFICNHIYIYMEHVHQIYNQNEQPWQERARVLVSCPVLTNWFMTHNACSLTGAKWHHVSFQAPWN